MDGVIINGAKRQRRKKWYIVSDIQVVVGQFVYVTKIDDSTCLEEWDGICGSQIKYHDSGILLLLTYPCECREK
jgi:hypothetical protein